MLSEKEKLDKLTHLGVELNQIRDLDIMNAGTAKATPAH